MRHILCYGDSNTWGYTPGTGERHAPDVRWTGVLRRLLGEGWEVLEEGMNGRTTVFDNPMSPGRNGSAYLLTCLETHKPLDLVILMLGTNDLRFTDAWGAAEGAAALVKSIRLYNHMEESTHIFPGKPRILLIAPILAHADLDNRDVIGRWRSLCRRGGGAGCGLSQRGGLRRPLRGGWHPHGGVGPRRAGRGRGAQGAGDVRGRVTEQTAICEAGTAFPPRIFLPFNQNPLTDGPKCGMLVQLSSQKD